MRTWVIVVFALIFGSIFYALEPQAVNELFHKWFTRSRTAVEDTSQRVQGTLGLNSEHVQLDARPLTVEVADSAEERSQGLSGRDALGENRGMLFVFPTADRYEFTMRGMRFPLDFIWLRAGTVVAVTERVPPPAAGSDPVTVRPPGAVDAVLEVNAGSVEAWDLGVGAALVRPPA